MTAGNMAAFSAMADPYGPMSTTTLIGRSWNLMKRNAKVAFSLILAPILMFTLTSFLLTLPSSFQTLSGSSGNYLVMIVLVFALSMVLSLCAWWVLLLACCAISRVYYLALTRGEPGTIGEALRFVASRWVKLTGLYGLLVFLNLLFIFPYGFVMLVGFLATAFLMQQVALLNASTMQIGGGLLLVLIGFLTVAALSFLFILQILINIFPINLIAAAEEEPSPAPNEPSKRGFIAIISASLDHIAEDGISVFRTMGAFFGMMFRNLPRVAAFGLALMVFYAFLALFLQIPMFIWLSFELHQLSLNPESLSSAVLPMHVHLISQLWSSLVNAIVWSFTFASITLFFYDCKVRTEGLDMKLTLANFEASASQRLSAKRNNSL